MPSITPLRGREITRTLNGTSDVFSRPGGRATGRSFTSGMIRPSRLRNLRECGLETLVITGVSTNNSVEATVRMAGNLGFQSYLVADACFTFARRDFHGRLRTADEVHSMSLANLHEEYCTVLDTAAVLADK